MVFCKFFLQGNCRFGENCKFEHQINDGRQQHSSILRPQNFASNPVNVNTNANTNVDTNTLIRAVANDMLQAERGGQWLISCYAPFKEKPNFPGFDEQSFEEVRWGYYEAQCMGTVNQYKQQFQMLSQAAILKLRSLQNPSQEAINAIKTIYNSSTSNSPTVYPNSPNFSNPSANVFGNNQNNLFNNTNTNRVFGQATTFGNTNVFGQSNQQQTSPTPSLFAAANQKLFVGTQQQQNSVFGGNQVANPSNQSIFGAAQPNTNFGTSFGQPFAGQNQGFGVVQPTQQTSQFGMQQQFAQSQTGTAGFGAQQTGTSPLFGAQQNSSPFGTQLQTNSPLLGPPQNSTSPFNVQQNVGLPGNANQQQNPPPFNIQQQNSATPFATQQQGPTPFGLQEVSQAATPFVNPSSIFGNNLQQTQSHTPLSNSSSAHSSSIFGSSNTTMVSTGIENVKDENVYSKLEELSESDIKSYSNDSFEFGKIPEKPPTIQMCL